MSPEAGSQNRRDGVPWRSAALPFGLFALFGILPFAAALVLSGFDYNPVDPSHPGRFVGLGNYMRALLHDVRLHNSVFITLGYAVVTVLLELALALVLALVLFDRLVTNRFLLACALVPSALSPMLVALMWKLVLQSEFGVGTYLLRAMNLLENRSILGDETLARITLVLVDCWQWIPAVAALLVGGLVTRSSQLLEVAELDGASRWLKLRDVTLPHLAPVLGIVGILRFADALREFEKPYLLTGGGPGASTEFLSLYISQVMFDHWDFGYGASLSVIGYVLATLIAYGFFNIVPARSRGFRAMEL